MSKLIKHSFERYIVIIIDQNLKLSFYIDNVVIKLRKPNNLIKTIKRDKNSEFKLFENNILINGSMFNQIWNNFELL